MFKNEIIAVCDDSSLGSMASESVQNPWIEVRKKKTRSRGKNNWAGHQVKTSLQGAPPFDNKNIANQDEWPPCSMTRESLRTAAVKVCKKTARPGGKNKSAWRQVDRFLQGTPSLSITINSHAERFNQLLVDENCACAREHRRLKIMMGDGRCGWRMAAHVLLGCSKRWVEAKKMLVDAATRDYNLFIELCVMTAEERASYFNSMRSLGADEEQQFDMIMLRVLGWCMCAPIKVLSAEAVYDAEVYGSELAQAWCDANAIELPAPICVVYRPDIEGLCSAHWNATEAPVGASSPATFSIVSRDRRREMARVSLSASAVVPSLVLFTLPQQLRIDDDVDGAAAPPPPPPSAFRAALLHHVEACTYHAHNVRMPCI